MCLIVVPRPQTLCEIAVDCFDVCKLLLCGDVETNPGPTVEEMFESLMNGQAIIHKEIADLKIQQSGTDKSVTEVLSRIAEVDKVLLELKVKSLEVDALKKTVNKLEETITLQNAKLANLEDRSRRSNLVIFGVADAPDESEQDLRGKVVENIFSRRLGVSCTSVQRIHRLGKRVGKRPIILCLQDYKEKVEIRRNAKKLKGTNVYIQNDYSQETLNKRRLLWNSASVERTNKLKVFLVNDKLRIGNDLFAWDESSNARVKVATANEAPVGE